MPARRAFAFFSVAAVILVGCGGDSTDDSAAPSTPLSAVADWLGAVADGDVDTIATLVDPVDVALLAGAENAFTLEQLAAVVEAGLPEASAAGYWRSFATGFEDVLGMPVDELSISDAEEFMSGGERFAAVTVGVDEATTEVITHLVDGVWQVDMVATSGPALAVQIRRLVTDLAESGDEATARAYAQAAVSSLGAAHSRAPDRTLELELEAIESLAVARDR